MDKVVQAGMDKVVQVNPVARVIPNPVAQPHKIPPNMSNKQIVTYLNQKIRREMLPLLQAKHQNPKNDWLLNFRSPVTPPITAPSQPPTSKSAIPNPTTKSVPRPTTSAKSVPPKVATARMAT